MARRTLSSDTQSRYFGGYGSESNTWNDGSVFATGYVASEYGIVAFNWWNGSQAERPRCAHDKRLHWLRLEYIVDGTRHSRTVHTDKLSMLGIVRRAKRFAQEKRL